MADLRPFFAKLIHYKISFVHFREIPLIDLAIFNSVAGVRSFAVVPSSQIVQFFFY